MTTRIFGNLYIADKGKIFQHKETKQIMGTGICIGTEDSIDNYEEVELSTEIQTRLLSLEHPEYISRTN